jgi:hypothetical protein
MMKRLFGYIIGLLTLLVVFAMVFVAAGIYDNGNNITIEPYFLRTALTGVSATDVPRSIDDIGQRRLRDWLIQKFVTEYFYVIPDVENVAQREKAGGLNSVIYYMSDRRSDVFKNWVNNVVPEIRQMAEDGVMRTVTVFDEIVRPNPESNYYQVEYELKTWYKPNDMDNVPEITRGKMYISVTEGIDGIRPIENVQRVLARGVNPAIVFSFWVNDIQYEKE